MSVPLLWQALEQVRSLEFVARSRGNTGWTGQGTGSVTIEVPAPEILVFQEAGRWHPTAGKILEFRNIYRWSHWKDRVRLEHLRFGAQHAVYLFDLAPETDTVWSSVAPHLCRDDAYQARLELRDDGISVQWNVIGPEKDEEIAYHYGFDARDG